MSESRLANWLGCSFPAVVIAALFSDAIAMMYGFAWWTVPAAVATILACAAVGAIIGLWFAWLSNKFGGYDF